MKNLKRVIGFLLCMVMLLSNISGVSFAAEAGGLCEHHTEHLGCGYVEAESACDYVCEICAQGEEETTEPEAAEEPDKPGAQTRVGALETGTGVQAAPDVDLLDNEELFACFAERELYGYGISTYGVAASENLNSAEQAIYNILKAKVEAVAVNGGSTVFEISEIDGLKTVWTNAELGVSSIDDVAMVEAAFINQFNLSDLMVALLNDCPFDLYWYDKISGVNMSCQVDLAGYDDGMQIVWDSASIVKLTFTFAVSSDYRSGEYTVTTDVAGITTAKNNAAQVVADNAGKSDYEKLLAYKNYICETVSYDQAAASDSTTPYGDPWQLISVFDGDSATNVVCEGYAKAFQYLCDLTTFKDDTACYMVSGQMDTEQHMWNVVTLGGSNYLVDVTNSDAGTAGQDGSLFLAGGNGSIAAGYTVAECQYIYDAETVSCWGEDTDSILAISNQNYNADGDGEEADDPIASGACGENLTWTLDDTGTLTISGTGAMAQYDMFSPHAPWYNRSTSITSVVIEEGVTTISDAAFYGLARLKSVEIPASITKIDTFAFYRCSALTEINLPKNVSEIGEYAFGYCENLQNINVSPENTHYTSVDGVLCKNNGTKLITYPAGRTDAIIPESIRTICSNAFFACNKLISITIPKYIITLEYGPIDSCENLEEIIIVGDVDFSYDAFFSCEKVSSIKAVDSTEYTSIDGVLYNKDVTTLIRCPEAIDSMIVPNTVKTIGKGAFYACEKLKEVAIPEGVTNIGGYAFVACYSLKNVTVPIDVQSIGYWAFFGCSKMEHVYYAGTQAQWDAIAKDDISLNAKTKVIYNHPEHNVVTMPRSDATCTEGGWTEGSYCSICNMTFSAQVAIPATGHSWTGAPCTEVQTCTVCGETIPPQGHTWFTGGTCLNPEKCTECGELRNEPGHTFTDSADDTCDICGLFVLRGCVGESLGVSVTTPYDYKHYISGDGSGNVTMVYTGQSSISIPGYTRYSKNYQLTFSEPGLYELTFVQYSTGSTLTFGAEISDHDWNLEHHFDATCSSKGYETYICNQCYTTEQRNFTDMIPHTWNDATCTAPKTCKVCSATEGSTLSHSEVTDKAVAATCTATGLTEGKHCSVCEKVLVAQSIVAVLGHEMSDWVVTDEPTCTEDGSKRRDCSRCDHFETEVITATGHDHEAIVTPPTCTEDGYTTYTCSACGDSYRSNFTEASHKEEILPAKDATCYDDGLTEGRQCSVCGEILVAQEKIPAPRKHTFNSDQDPFCALCGEVRSVPMFRMYDPNSGEHFYTGSVEEREILVKAGWNYEGVGFNFPVVGNPVHRLYEPATGEHLYTMDEAEMERLLSSGWNYEGVAFNSAPSTEIAQYRLHNPNGTRGAYHFTGDIGERDWLISLGWKYQGIGWYSCLR